MMKIKTKCISSLPSIRNGSASMWGSCAYYVASYLTSGTGGDLYNLFPQLLHIDMLKALIAHGSQPFYASDVFECEDSSIGGFINGLSMNHIIQATGNKKEVFIPVRKDMYKKVEINEWELAFSPAELENALNGILSLM